VILFGSINEISTVHTFPHQWLTQRHIHAASITRECNGSVTQCSRSYNKYQTQESETLQLILITMSSTIIVSHHYTEICQINHRLHKVLTKCSTFYDELSKIIIQHQCKGKGHTHRLSARSGEKC